MFVIPIAAELDLKKGCEVSRGKISRNAPCEGYYCGDRLCAWWLYGNRNEKQFPTVIDSSAQHQEYIYVSGGKIGMQIKLKPDDLKKAARAEYGEITF